jgi:hypothetical protein
MNAIVKMLVSTRMACMHSQPCCAAGIGSIKGAMEGDKVVVLCNPDCGLPSIQPQSVIQIEMHRKW